MLRGTWIHRLWNNVRRLSWVVIGLAALLGMIGFMGAVDGPLPYPRFFKPGLVDFHRRLSADLIGVSITVILIDTAHRWRAIQQDKKHLIAAMASQDNGTAQRAVADLRAVGWLVDGSLQGAHLGSANLQGAHLEEANLQGAHLEEANLQKAFLVKANLQGAGLWKTNLQGAFLLGADLHGANLWEANLRGADLVKASLPWTDLARADLQGAVLPDSTELPDDDTWREAFETWCQRVKLDETGAVSAGDAKSAADQD